MTDRTEPRTLVDCRDAAASAGLRYASTDTPGISRHRVGRGFSYRTAQGTRLSDPAALAHIRSLAIPPAWRSVWICPDRNGHIQAVGFDDKGRKQYRYHPKFREARDGVKFEHMLLFASVLPRLRRRVAADMAAPGLGRAKILATVVHLLETTMIRVGNASYARRNRSYGLTTLLSRHVKVEGAAMKFHFKGKSGKVWRLDVRDRRIAKIVRSCQELPGQHLFQYVDEAGGLQSVTSADVNSYLKQASGADITAKDFRLWTGTVLAATTLAACEQADTPARARKIVTRAIEQVSTRLGNTPAICRKCYIHPAVVSAYVESALTLEIGESVDEPATLRAEEAAVLAFLQARLARDPIETRVRVGGRGEETALPSPPRRSAEAMTCAA